MCGSGEVGVIPMQPTRMETVGEVTAPAPKPGWRGGFARQAVWLTISTRLALFGVVWLSLRAAGRLPLYPTQLPDDFLPKHVILNGWARWDTAHYVAVAQFGYGNPVSPSPQGGLGFFPTFPLLMRALASLAGHAREPEALAIAGIAIANLCLVVCAGLLGKLATEQVGPGAALDAVLLMLVAPFSHFLSAAYSESLFIALVLGSLALGRAGRWWWAGLVAGIASATRLAGVLLLPALLLLAVRHRARWRDRIALVVFSPSGLAVFLAYCWWKFDDALIYFDAQSEWGSWSDHVRFYAELFTRHPKQALTGDPRHLIVMLNVAFAILAIAAIPLMWRWLDEATALMSSLLIVIHTALTWVSLGRYLLPAVGLYLVGARLLAYPRIVGWPRDAIVVCCALLTTTLAILFAHGFWIV